MTTNPTAPVCRGSTPRAVARAKRQTAQRCDMNERPTCGTCPHRISYGCKGAAGYCYAQPYGAAAKETQIGLDSPGCIHHPDMPAYVEAWKLAREKPQ